MSLSRKHFERVAEAIRVERIQPGQLCKGANIDRTLDRVAENLATQFKMINPRFDKARFIEATQRSDETASFEADKTKRNRILSAV